MVGAILALADRYWFGVIQIARTYWMRRAASDGQRYVELDSVIRALERRSLSLGLTRGIAYLIHFLFLQEDLLEVIARYRAAARKTSPHPVGCCLYSASFTAAKATR